MKSSLVKTLLKILFVGGLLYFLTRKGFISLQATRTAFTHWPNIALATALMGLNALLGAVRWQWLLRAQNIRLPWARTIELTFVGNFFNIALPGAVSGDFVKAFYIGKDLPGQRTRAFGSIFFDRLAGLSALVLLAAIAMVLGMPSFSNDAISSKMITVIRPFILLAGAGVLVFYSYLFLVKENHDPLLALFRKLEKLHVKASALTRIYESVRHYYHHKKTVFAVLAISLFIHSLVGMALIIFANALGETQLNPLALYVVFPLGLLITAVPIAPAGVGTGHTAFLYFFNLIGSARGADLFTLYALMQIFYGAVGGIFYLRFRAQAIPGEIATASN
jgi:uncharacterized protein (TIRG00374 family)